MLERPRRGERAVLVHVNFRAREDQEQLDEFRDLAQAAGARVVSTVTTAREAPDPRFFVGRGKADEIREQVTLGDADLVLVNHDLAPAHQRNGGAAVVWRPKWALTPMAWIKSLMTY